MNRDSVIDIEEVFDLSRRLARINAVPIEDAVFVFRGKVIDISDEERDAFRSTGLSNVDFVQGRAWRLYPKWQGEKMDPIEYLESEMRLRGLERSDLEAAIGSRGRVSEVLNRRRKLTLPMIRRLCGEFGLSADILTRETKDE